MRTAFGQLTSAVPGLLIYLHLQAVHQFIEAHKEIDHCHHLKNTFVVQSQLLRRRSMNGESVLA